MNTLTRHFDENTERSGIYWGNVRHRRFGAITHEFSYQLYMMGLDLDEIEQTTARSLVFGTRWFNPIRFVETDYVPEKTFNGDESLGNHESQINDKTSNSYKTQNSIEPKTLKQRIALKVKSLGGQWSESNRVTMLAQCRCFGIYFSPINCFFCFDENLECRYMLAEVSNTPWRERHYYLIDMQQELKAKKDFHVSPFMDLDMTYHWKIKPPSRRTLVHIENHRDEQYPGDKKVFDATLALEKQPMTASDIRQTLIRTPAMTTKVVLGIYYQALKLFIKKVPFISHPDSVSKPPQYKN
ncbi:DUF1365 domain-containing protein [Vibrio fortis]|uniref:DUF1365 domain-containing protein n=1 Tax=Vibrio fortis TaxID=212667 RepID=UPI0038CD636A